MAGGFSRERIDHGVRQEAAGPGGLGCQDGTLIAGHAGDDGGPLQPFDVQFLDPSLRQLRRIGGREFPAQRLGYGVGALSGLRGESLEKGAREEVNVRVGDGAITPGGLHPVCSRA